MKGSKYGTHRVIKNKGDLPQPAEKIDNNMEIYDNEILIEVKTLNIDSASFTQIKKEAGGDEKQIEKIMQRIVNNRGKHHNPVTGSGGMLVGIVEEIGEDLKGKIELEVGDEIATLVSLSLTPLLIEEILEIRKDTDQVDIKGKAVLFESGIYAKLPEDMSRNLALAVLDVAGAPAQTAKLVEPGDSVLIIGAGGKSGTLCLHEAQKRAGISGKVIALEYSQEGCERVESLGLADAIIQADATKPTEVLNKIEEVTNGELVDLTINCVNIPNTELSCILATKDSGKVYFFSMATSFTAAALGAEGVGKDTEMLIGNGYTKNHSEIALQVLRENEDIKELFEKIYL
ncbi:3,5-diaminobexanoate dehydrogenase [Halanaerobium saccharolyticum subsp. saccharolyticum DSM 6643]|uniref:3,5-diaminobexanoate dehydrogenase n=1 Tax=Halanaerobium saccharolyticum subsp. saccharolyticum DSM 6643 TaxID=1293054 RepID=M5DWV1_9FIRM|nr:zinc-binding dehydrogenase [Halanaerobium saccharolyticum]CCU77848.1 3,5-diaminobexanoate dehydrogenase [Halanaerobium saccharolyticum subsp. saccharolyticum DSM 6643]